ncbi:hypothetical protein B0J18DRAFT_420192 [Chaetomium sp. MPI-SDFR-AT-0129]|nr:hypothetical protein B0J18DRAFT_420192 [Chaetomium sp. MPI-SDFR-AT-0129]
MGCEKAHLTLPFIIFFTPFLPTLLSPLPRPYREKAQDQQRHLTALRPFAGRSVKNFLIALSKTTTLRLRAWGKCLGAEPDNDLRDQQQLLVAVEKKVGAVVVGQWLGSETPSTGALPTTIVCQLGILFIFISCFFPKSCRWTPKLGHLIFASPGTPSSAAQHSPGRPWIFRDELVILPHRLYLFYAGCREEQGGVVPQ